MDAWSIIMATTANFTWDRCTVFTFLRVDGLFPIESIRQKGGDASQHAPAAVIAMLSAQPIGQLQRI
jgi:hypothetical protein